MLGPVDSILLQEGLICDKHCNWSSRNFPHQVQSCLGLYWTAVSQLTAAAACLACLSLLSFVPLQDTHRLLCCLSSSICSFLTLPCSSLSNIPFSLVLGSCFLEENHHPQGLWAFLQRRCIFWSFVEAQFLSLLEHPGNIFQAATLTPVSSRVRGSLGTQEPLCLALCVHSGSHFRPPDHNLCISAHLLKWS